MGISEMPDVNPQIPDRVPEGFALPEITDEQEARLSVASRIALALLKPEGEPLRTSVYPGSSFTPVIGEAVGIVPSGDTPEKRKEESAPVLAALKALRDAKALAYEPHSVPTLINNKEMLVSAIEVVVKPEKMLDFVEKELAEQE